MKRRALTRTLVALLAVAPLAAGCGGRPSERTAARPGAPERVAAEDPPSREADRARDLALRIFAGLAHGDLGVLESNLTSETFDLFAGRGFEDPSAYYHVVQGRQGEKPDWQPLLGWLKEHPMTRTKAVNVFDGTHGPGYTLVEIESDGGYLYLGIRQGTTVDKVFLSSERMTEWD